MKSLPTVAFLGADHTEMYRYLKGLKRKRKS